MQILLVDKPVNLFTVRISITSDSDNMNVFRVQMLATRLGVNGHVRCGVIQMTLVFCYQRQVEDFASSLILNRLLRSPFPRRTVVDRQFWFRFLGSRIPVNCRKRPKLAN